MLSEMLEDYYESQDEELLQDFKMMLWSSKYTYKRYKKAYTYKVSEEKLQYRNDLIDLFRKYERTEVFYSKSFYKSDLESIDYIRVHINNMYGYLTDKEVYLPKEYYQLLDVPKREYFRAIKDIDEGVQVDFEAIQGRIESSLHKAENIRKEKVDRKIDLTFKEYTTLIDSYIDRLFENYLPPYEYEVENGWELRNGSVGWSEDNYVIKYFCRSLTGYLQNYVKDLQPKEEVVKKCIKCDSIIENTSNSRKYCLECFKKSRRDYVRRKVREHRKKNVNK